MPAHGAALDGCVTKAPLLLAPVLARAGELVQYLTYKLHESGLVVVRAEQRVLNAEVAAKLYALDVDVASATTAHAHSSALYATSTTHSHALVGSVYVFVLAGTNCHARLVALLHKLRTGDEVYEHLLRDALAHDRRDGVDSTLTSANAYDDVAVTALMWTSSSADGARRAVAALFPRMLAHDVPSTAQSREYVQAHLKSALVPALTELCKVKPREPLCWLAEYLLEHNVQLPPMRNAATLSST